MARNFTKVLSNLNVSYISSLHSNQDQGSSAFSVELLLSDWCFLMWQLFCSLQWTTLYPKFPRFNPPDLHETCVPLPDRTYATCIVMCNGILRRKQPQQLVSWKSVIAKFLDPHEHLLCRIPSWMETRLEQCKWVKIVKYVRPDLNLLHLAQLETLLRTSV